MKISPGYFEGTVKSPLEDTFVPSEFFPLIDPLPPSSPGGSPLTFSGPCSAIGLSEVLTTFCSVQNFVQHAYLCRFHEPVFPF